ncbi:ABC-type transporter, integral membrane subunit [Treponema brennaborense DSM 12168]|uniref:ABC-type transporter, integral membrane subunit n=2 Tax=Treponema TaxID=157 RepID=F4LJ11_TREBD|nr:ABC-type transporter, integral membrane subunit [Treponema brennaborense DSM 12168]
MLQRTGMKRLPAPAAFGISFTVMLVLWQLAAAVVRSPLILPYPAETAAALCRNIRTPVFWQHIGATALRSVAAFAVSVTAGTVIGVCCGVSKTFRRLLEFPLAVIRSTPVVSFILLSIFWFGSSLVPVFVSVLMSLPVVIAAVSAGIGSADRKLLDCARVYGFSAARTARYVYLPSCTPYFWSGALSAFGLSWKVVAAGEVLSLPRRAAGTLLYNAKVHLETADVFAVTIVLIILCFTLETGFAALLRRRGLRTDGV